MLLVIADAEESDVKSALARLHNPEPVKVLLNPSWLTPHDDPLWIACGAPAVKMFQAAGLMPKKGGVAANRGRLFKGAHPEGWAKPVDVGVTFAPQIYHIEIADFVTFETDLQLYRRYERTGTMDAKLGHYAYTYDLSGVIAYLKHKHHTTGEFIEVSIDTETEGLNPFDPEKQIVCVQVTAHTGCTDVVYTLNASKEKIHRLITQLAWIANQPWIKVIGANFKYDMLWLRVKWGIVFQNFAFDTCNGGSLLDENRSNTLNIHTKVYCPDLAGYDDEFNRTQDKSRMGEVPWDRLLPYAGGDTDACLQSYYEIRKGILSDNLTKNGKPAKNSLASLYINVIHPALKAVHRMEHIGVCVDEDKFHAFGADLEARMVETSKIAASVIPKPILDKYGGLNDQGMAPLSKPKMIAEFLFSPQGLNLKPTVTTEKTGAPSTTEYHLAQFKDHPEAKVVIERYLDFKSVQKMHGTYYVGFLKHLRQDGRWHPSYIIHKQGTDKNNEQDAGGTVTGRASATDPAFQCVTGDAEIMTDKGLRPAASLIDPLIPDDAYNPFAPCNIALWGSNGFQAATRVFKSWRADILRVRLSNGVELKCTPEHPVMVRAEGWVRARDLNTSHQIELRSPVERPAGPEWASQSALEALGIILGAGYLSLVGDRLDVEVPLDMRDRLIAGMESIGFNVKVDHVEDDRAVVTTRIVPTSGYAALSWLLALPDRDSPPAPYPVRGTQAVYALLRGFIVSAGHVRPMKDNALTLRLRASRKDALRMIQTELMLDGMSPGTLRSKDTAWELRLGSNSARHLSTVCGLGLADEADKAHPVRTSPGLYVESVEPAGAGWVYDFTVPTTHDFTANGLLVHNTVPKHSYWGQRLRECIVAPEGHLILGRDYAQGELKIAACWAGETKMVEAYKNGVDLHTLTAATVNSMSYEEALALKTKNLDAYKSLRQKGKAGNFGLIYGMTAFGFMMYADQVYGVKLTIEEAEAFRDAYFALYPGLPEWHERQILEAETTGMVRSPLGRVRHLPNMHSPIKKTKKHSQNQAINSPIQGTLVDFMWMAMGIIEQEKPDLLLPFAQVHDQGLWYVPEDRWDEALSYSGDVMENLPLMEKFGWNPPLKFTTDAELGHDLANLKEIKG